MEYLEFSDIKERYRQIKDFDDYYITEYGNVYSTRGPKHKLHKIKAKEPGREDKYLNVILCRDDGQYTKSIHRLVAEYFVDGYFEGAVPNHIDGNNRNNRYDNLEWVTVKENVRKSYITSGLSAKRNYKEWKLYNPSGNLVGIFYSHQEMEKFVVDNKLPAKPCMLTKHGKSEGFYVTKERVNMKL